ncbi:MAG: MOSC domain-containing protein [Candidatus Marinimicrobia bacterium]|jgi:hypothetical protein|nr:MOSC domain-containing protein [Candidatus Neomarinimicrobiota bacterium]MBT3634246.1 MOSC domain-containing protein [Candidatus Neomarinimicrobiota bacterium]MBT3682955.1 MOSC domain-containing protein [Candidatus Neomarinimicrobiota bacterium]MBT3760055.1 MOSC domain-containing protein [Candidatus Neomarinimicrobiota bacterium]MBT3896178.1 MOSC domain-containing protein [Candidatus Neomarinimicrobiota bacterium]
MSLKINELNIHPLKSGKSISLKKVKLCEAGFQYDRQWMLVDKNGQFLTQRTHPHLANISFDPVSEEGIIHCSYLGTNQFNFLINSITTTKIQVSIWDESFQPCTYPDIVDEWFSEILQIPCKLVHIYQTQKRTIHKSSVGKSIRVNFPDGYPLLLISQASVDDLNSRLTQPVQADRFRANIVVNGTQPFSEDEWKTIRIKDIPLKVVKPCARCNIINVDQKTGNHSREPLRTLSLYRNFNNGIHFGVNMIHLSEGLLSIGDEVEIIE